MLEAPPYKQIDIQAPVKINLKLFVPFKDEKEKNEFISKQLNEDNEDDFDENDESNMTVAIPATSSNTPALTASAGPAAATNQPTTSANASAMTSANAMAMSASASSLSPGSSNQTDLYREPPDGKYESRVLEFTYFAPGELSFLCTDLFHVSWLIPASLLCRYPNKQTKTGYVLILRLFRNGRERP